MSEQKSSVQKEKIITPKAFFETSEAPENIKVVEKQVASFIKAHHNDKAHRRIVLVTSGGTTVPLEKNTVRFIDNFSSGNRGAASVENFLRMGYAVIFLHRPGSVYPFTRCMHRALKCKGMDGQFISALSVDEQKSTSVSFQVPAAVGRVLRYGRQCTAAGRLLPVPFVSISEYLHLLRMCCRSLDGIGRDAMVYSAAAVSDFYIPTSSMATHKMQSSDGPLRLQLPNTPKVCSEMRSRWCPRAVIILFKLETDQQILFKKARSSIAKYSVDGMVANLLQTRYDEVFIVTPGNQEDPLRVTKDERVEFQEGPELDQAEIEAPLVGALATLHAAVLKGK